MLRTLCLYLCLVCTIAAIAQAQAPDPPTTPSPVDNASGVEADASLCAEVIDPQGGLLNATFYGRDLSEQPAEDFTIIVLPDAQYYAQTYPEIYHSQIDWVIKNRDLLNIVFVSHVGDIVQLANMPPEWNVADAAMSKLEDTGLTERAEGIPYGLSVGNHDQYGNNRAGFPGDSGSTTVNYNNYFPVSRYADKSWWGGSFDNLNDNSYQLFTAGDMDFIIIHNEFDNTFMTMTADALAWSSQVLTNNKDRRAILTSHSLLCNGVHCPTTLFADWSTQGQATWDMAKFHDNLFLMLCGHAGSSAQQPRRTDAAVDGHLIHSLLANYQRGEDCPYWCGNGWLRIMTFKPSQNLISSQTYSPWLDEFRNDQCSDGNSCHEFDLIYDMEGGIQFSEIGSVAGAQSGTSPCIPWSGREDATEYEWFVKASNPADEMTTGPRWTFTSNGSCSIDADCDEGDPCTVDTCSGFTCARTLTGNCCVQDADCDDDNYCTDDSCVTGSCTYTDNTNACNDDDACTENDQCSSGVCAGTSLACDDNNACTQDTCTDGTCGNAYQPTPTCCGTHSDCDDGDASTDDMCNGGGACTNTAIPGWCLGTGDCADDGDECTLEMCPTLNRRALALDGNSHMTAHKSVPGLEAETFTIECWFKWDGGGSPTATSGWFANQPGDVGGIIAIPLVTKGHADQDSNIGGAGDLNRDINYFLGIHVPTEDRPEYVLAADFEPHSTASVAAQNFPVYGSTPITPDEWHHAAATYDGSCWQLYLDGHPQTGGTNCPNEPPAFDTECHFAAGSSQDKEGGVGAQHFSGLLIGRFSGLIDEVRIWDHARSRSELVSDMSHEVEATASGLLGRWGFNEMTPGSTFITPDALDLHPGILVGSTLSNAGLLDLGAGSCLSLPLAPSDVQGALLNKGAGTIIDWLEELGVNTTYDIVSGAITDLLVDDGAADAQCIASDVNATEFVDVRPDPNLGQGYYYLIRAQNPCGDGTYGSSSASNERLPALDCP